MTFEKVGWLRRTHEPELLCTENDTKTDRLTHEKRSYVQDFHHAIVSTIVSDDTFVVRPNAKSVIYKREAAVARRQMTEVGKRSRRGEGLINGGAGSER